MEQFFKNPRDLMRLRQGPLAPYMASFAKHLSDQGYAVDSGRTYIKLISDFSRWLKQNHVEARETNTEHTRKFLRYRTRRKLLGRGDSAALRRFLDLLRREGVIAEELVAVPTPAERYTDEFVLYLQQERGLAIATITNYRSILIRFLSTYFSRRAADLSRLCAADIVGFVQQQAAFLSATAAKNMTTALRSFLQYARYKGYIDLDLSAAVPTVASWSMASIPKSIPADQVELVLSSCDRQSATGRRDYAILLLLARLGLRAGEIVSLVLEDIDWQAGEITVHGKSGHRPKLPLSIDVGEALAAYLRNGRPRTNNRFVFLREKAPIRGFDGPGTVGAIVRRALARAGINAPQKGAHQFRHYLATELLRQGASLSEIGELLGHRCPDTTAIYAKVDLVSLRTIALPWPGGAQ